MKLVFAEAAWEDYMHWQKTGKKIAKRISRLIEETARSPFEGIGKPEPLKHALAGYWSRRIDGAHRFVYRVSGQELQIAQLRYHYGK